MGKESEEGRRPNASQLAFFDVEVESFVKGKDELNLIEFPIAVVSDSAKAGQLSLKFSDTISDSSTGKQVDRSVTVHATEEWGLPAAQDDEVMIGLLQICHLAGKRQTWPKHFCFTRYQLCKILRWSMGGASYRRIYTALHRLSTTSYNYRYSWRDKTNQEWIPSQVFSYIQELKVHEADRPTDTGFCEVTWSDAFHKSLEAGNLKSINFSLFVSLGSAISKRLYRFLDKRFGAKRPIVSYDLKTLAFEKLGIGRSYSDAAQIKRLLMSAIRELEEKKFVAPATPEERFEKVSRGKWRVRFKPYKERRERILSGPTSQGAESDIERRLREEGVFPDTARSFVATFPAEYLEQKLDEFQFRQADTSPGGLLATSIRKDLPPPSGYRSPDERAKDEEEKRVLEERRAETLREKELKAEEERSREERELLAAEKKLKALDESTRASLKNEAKRRFPDGADKTIYWTMVGLVREKRGRETQEKSAGTRKKLV